MDNQLLKQSLTRITTAIQPQQDVIKDFVTQKTFLHGRPFTTKHHHYQELLMQELVDPDVQFVCYKVAQAGASEVIYRILLAYCANIPGFTTALLLPSLIQTSEVIKLRISGIISESPTLKALINKKIDSSSVKAFVNGSVLYGLSGSGTSKSTTISRPLRCIVADELQYINMKTLSSMSARQRAQEHKSTIYFSSPRYSDSDIDSEIKLCGHIWEAELKCNRCNHTFFPSFYDDVRLKGFSDPINSLSIQKVSSLDLDLADSWLECPRCHRPIPYGHPHTNWVNTATTPNLPKRGMKIGPFDLPHTVTIQDLLTDMVRMDDRNEFNCQMLAIPISSAENALDITQIKLENHDPGSLNVMGLDIGKMSCACVGSITEGRLYIHHVEFIPLKNLRDRVRELYKEHRVVGMVADLMPYTEVTAHFVNTLQNTWACVYNNSLSAAKKLELFTLKIKEDEAIGNIQVINCNQTVTFDFLADQLMNGLISYKSSPMDATILNQLSVMSRQRDYSAGRIEDGAEITYRWRKPNRSGKIDDHVHHSTCYCLLASKLLSKSRYGGGVSNMIHIMRRKGL